MTHDRFLADATDRALDHLQTAVAAERRNAATRLAEAMRHVADLQDVNRALVVKIGEWRARVRDLEAARNTRDEGAP